MTDRVVLFPSADNPLSHEGTAVRIADDSYGGLNRLFSHSYNEPQFHFIRRSIKEVGRFVLVDVGMNAGLFSRQVLIEAGDQCTRVFGYEPDFPNYSDAKYNLSHWSSKCNLRQHALGDCDASFSLFRDLDNCGNYSIYKSAMADNPSDVITATMIPAQKEAQIWHRVGHPIFYKSDVQGYDEELATLIDFPIWRDRIFAAVLEIWRIEKPPVDRELFGQILECFPNRRLLHSGRDVTTADVFEYIAERDGAWDDLALWR